MLTLILTIMIAWSLCLLISFVCHECGSYSWSQSWFDRSSILAFLAIWGILATATISGAIGNQLEKERIERHERPVEAKP